MGKEIGMESEGIGKGGGFRGKEVGSERLWEREMGIRGLESGNGSGGSWEKK